MNLNKAISRILSYVAYTISFILVIFTLYAGYRLTESGEIINVLEVIKQLFTGTETVTHTAMSWVIIVFSIAYGYTLLRLNILHRLGTKFINETVCVILVGFISACSLLFYSYNVATYGPASVLYGPFHLAIQWLSYVSFAITSFLFFNAISFLSTTRESLRKYDPDHIALKCEKKELIAFKRAKEKALHEERRQLREKRRLERRAARQGFVDQQFENRYGVKPIVTLSGGEVTGDKTKDFLRAKLKAQVAEWKALNGEVVPPILTPENVKTDEKGDKTGTKAMSAGAATMSHSAIAIGGIAAGKAIKTETKGQSWLARIRFIIAKRRALREAAKLELKDIDKIDKGGTGAAGSGTKEAVVATTKTKEADKTVATVATDAVSASWLTRFKLRLAKRKALRQERKALKDAQVALVGAKQLDQAKVANKIDIKADVKGDKTKSLASSAGAITASQAIVAGGAISKAAAPQGIVVAGERKGWLTRLRLLIAKRKAFKEASIVAEKVEELKQPVAGAKGVTVVAGKTTTKAEAAVATTAVAEEDKEVALDLIKAKRRAERLESIELAKKEKAKALELKRAEEEKARAEKLKAIEIANKEKDLIREKKLAEKAANRKIRDAEIAETRAARLAKWKAIKAEISEKRAARLALWKEKQEQAAQKRASVAAFKKEKRLEDVEARNLELEAKQAAAINKKVAVQDVAATKVTADRVDMDKIAAREAKAHVAAENQQVHQEMNEASVERTTIIRKKRVEQIEEAKARKAAEAETEKLDKDLIKAKREAERLEAASIKREAERLEATSINNNAHVEASGVDNAQIREEALKIIEARRIAEEEARKAIEARRIAEEEAKKAAEAERIEKERIAKEEEARRLAEVERAAKEEEARRKANEAAAHDFIASKKLEQKEAASVKAAAPVTQEVVKPVTAATVEVKPVVSEAKVEKTATATVVKTVTSATVAEDEAKAAEARRLAEEEAKKAAEARRIAEEATKKIVEQSKVIEKAAEEVTKAVEQQETKVVEPKTKVVEKIVEKPKIVEKIVEKPVIKEVIKEVKVEAKEEVKKEVVVDEGPTLFTVYHVLPINMGESWMIKKMGAEHPLATFKTNSEAREYVKEHFGGRKGFRIFFHNEEGKIIKK